MRLTLSALLVALACTATLLGAPAASTTPPSPRVAATDVAGVLSLRPAISQPGRRPTTSSGRTQALATFARTRTGQTVELQRDSGSGWQAVARGRQHRSGSTIFTLPTARACTAPSPCRAADGSPP